MLMCIVYTSTHYFNTSANFITGWIFLPPKKYSSVVRSRLLRKAKKIPTDADISSVATCNKKEMPIKLRLWPDCPQGIAFQVTNELSLSKLTNEHNYIKSPKSVQGVHFVFVVWVGGPYFHRYKEIEIWVYLRKNQLQ